MFVQIQNANHIYAALVANGMTCRSWALERGYNPRTVQMYIHRFAPNTGKKPKGKVGIRILRELSETIEFNLLEGIEHGK